MQEVTILNVSRHSYDPGTSKKEKAVPRFYREPPTLVRPWPPTDLSLGYYSYDLGAAFGGKGRK